MSLAAPQAKRRTNSFPRVSGDEPYLSRTERLVAAFSPRERG